MQNKILYLVMYNTDQNVGQFHLHVLCSKKIMQMHSIHSSDITQQF